MTANGEAPALPIAILEMVRRIADRFQPERVVLFGSYARGTAGSDSDADLLVVIEPHGTKRQQATAIDVALIGISLPADVIVVRREDLDALAPGSVLDEALKEGLVLYERQTEP